MELIEINGKPIGAGYPVYIVAEMSANHGHDYNKAVRIIEAARESGADAIKLQTYTPDTLTIDCDNEYFMIKGTPWAGRKLYDLYAEAMTPWEWHPKLKKVAEETGLDFFSTPFDATAVDFLEDMEVPAYKVASFENVDLPLLRKVGSTGKPVIISTGMATLDEIREAVDTLRESGCAQLALLKCTSVYPTSAEEMNLRAIPHLAGEFRVPVGLSDHTLELAVPVAAVALGACIVEKHFTLSREDKSPDSAFSLEPDEFRKMVDAVRTVEKALGKAEYGPGALEKGNLVFRRSLFVVKNMKAGDRFTPENVRAIRPGNGLHTRHLDQVLGRKAVEDIGCGTPLSWNLIEGE